MPRSKQDLTNEVFSHLTVKSLHHKNNSDKDVWLCECDCGRECFATARSLRWEIECCGCTTNGRPRKRYGGDLNKKYIIDVYKRGAQRRKLEFKLTVDQMEKLFKQNCYYCGIEPSTKRDFIKSSEAYVYNGIDRVDNNQGYLPDNVVTSCKVCNFAKRQLTTDEFLSWIHRAYKYNFREMEI